MKKTLILMLVAVAGSFVWWEAQVAHAEEPVEATFSATSECCENFQLFDGYPWFAGKYRIARQSYEFTTEGSLTAGGVRTTFTCDAKTVVELVIGNTETRKFHFGNREEWDCLSSSGQEGSLTLHNRGSGVFGEGFTATYTVLDGTGIFEEARGRIPNGSGIPSEGTITLTGN